jgi:hypothetical protein
VPNKSLVVILSYVAVFLLSMVVFTPAVVVFQTYCGRFLLPVVVFGRFPAKLGRFLLYSSVSSGPNLHAAKRISGSSGQNSTASAN